MAIPPRRADESGFLFRTSDAFFASDDTLRIVAWNDGAEALLGYAKEDVLGTPCHELASCPSLTRRLFCSGSAREARRAHSVDLVPTFGTQIETKSGERVCVDITTILAVPRRGSQLRLHVLRDLRRQREIEELLRQVVNGASRLSIVNGGHVVNGASRLPVVNGAGGNDKVGSNGDGRGPVEGANPCSWSVTAREREVIQLLAQGSSTDGIAAKLQISRRTARNHIQNILAKLRVHSRLEAVAYASTKGLI